MRDVRFVRHMAAAVIGTSLVFGGVAAGVGSIAPVASAQEAQAGSSAYVDVTSLNVRSTPSLSGTITTTLSFGTVVTLVGDPVSADGYVWYQVQQGGTTLGWSVNGFTLGTAPTDGGTIPTIPTTPTTPTTPTPPASGEFIYGDPVMVNTDLLNVRSSPSISASVLTVFDYGTSATVTGDAAVADGITWYPIDNYGWVAGQYLWLNACGCRDGVYPTDGENEGGGDTGGGSTTPDTDLNVTTDVLNVRSGPGLNSPIVGTLSFGAAVTVYNQATTADGLSWIPINGDETRWVAAQFVG